MDGLKRTRRPCRWIILGALAAPALLAAAPQLSISPLGYRIEQIAPVAGQARTYEVTGRAGVANTGDPALAVIAQLTSSTEQVQVLDGQVGFGNVQRNSPLWPALSLDTFRVRFVLPKSRSVPGLIQFLQQSLEALSWRVDCGNCGRNRPPVAHAGADQTVFSGVRVMLDGSGSSDPDGQPLQFAWAFVSTPSGSQVALSDATVVRPSFVPDREGIYVARLFVSDGIDVSTAATVRVTTRNSPPVARAGADRTAVVGARVRLDGSASSDVDGDSLTFDWSLLERPVSSGAALLAADPASPFTEWVIDRAGRYVLQLIVHDGESESTPDTVVVSTVNSTPVANAGADRTGVAGHPVELDGSASSDADGDALGYRWSLTPPAGSFAELSVEGAKARFVIDRPGVYLAQLIVNDGAADSAPDTVVVSTVNSAPVAHAGSARTVDPGEEVSLDGSASHDVDGDPIGFSWSLTSVPVGSVTALTDPHAMIPRMTPDRPGAYVGQLIVNDGRMNSAPATVTITARATPPPGPDTTPPAPPVTGLIVMARQDTAHVRVSGAAGSVEGRAQVTISSFTTGRSVTVTAADDGSFAASIAAADSDALLAAVTDTAGNASAIAPIGAVAPFDLTIDTPLPNQAFAGSTVVVAGRLRAPRNSGVTVNGKPAAVFSVDEGYAYRAQIEFSPGADGPLMIPVEVSAHTPDGRTRTLSTPVRIEAISPYLLEVSAADGPAPLMVGFELTDALGRGVRRVEFDFDGDGQADPVSADVDGAVQWRYGIPGAYLARATVTDDAGAVSSVTAPVFVHERDAFTAQVRAVWDEMNLALLRGNTAVAALRLNESARRRYLPAFEALREGMPAIVESFSPAEPTEAGSEVTEFVVMRELNGVPRAFFIYMARGQDGVWRVAEM